VLAAGLALAPSGASAKIVHEEVGSFNVENQLLAGVAVDNSAGANSGDVYVADIDESSLASSVLKFSSTGQRIATITGAETPAGSFGFVNLSTFAFSGIALDSSAGANGGDLYVADIEHDVIDRFDETGKFICQITGKIPVSSEEQKDECNGAAGSKNDAEGFEPTAVAVDASGDLYVADAKNAAIDKFGSKGEFEEEISGPDVTDPTELALDSSGALYFVNGGNALQAGTDAVKYSAGTFTVVDTSEPRDIAFDPKSGHFYAQDNDEAGGGGGRLDEYDSAWHLLATFFPKGQAISTIAVSATGELYVAAGTTGSIAIFAPDIVLPTVLVAPASGVSETAATLHGEVSPDAADGGTEVTRCEFEYVTQAQFDASKFAGAATVGCEPSTPYAAAQSVSANLTGLLPSTTYHYRLSAANANDRASDSEAPAEETFATTGAPTIAAESASGITRATATLEAQVDPNGHDTHYEFQYGETASYGTSVPIPAADIGEGQAPVSVGQAIGGLKLDATYHYRVVATNSSGSVPGSDQSFTTVPVAGIESQSVLAGAHTATIKVRIDPKMGLAALNGQTTCLFEYVTEAQHAASGYGAATTMPCTPGSFTSASEGQNVIVQLAGLASDTVYDYRFVLANEAGEEASEATLATFGIQPGSASFGLFDQEDGPYTQAGGHPYELTTAIAFNDTTFGSGFSPSSGRLKDVRVQLPPGLIGNPTAAGECTVLAADRVPPQCSPASQVGVLHVTLENEGDFKGNPVEHSVPLFNVVPSKGVAAELASGQINLKENATIEAHVRTGEGYGVSADSLNIPTVGLVKKVSVTIWGVPADPAHDSQRICPPGETGQTGVLEFVTVGCGSGEQPRAFLRAPTSCTASPLTTNVLADSYNAPGEFVEAQATMHSMEGCASLRFTPRIQAIPESASADSPTGLHVDLHIPQNEDPTGLAEADLKDAVVTLPPGMVVNPAQAGGLVGCPLLTGRGGEKEAREARKEETGINMESEQQANCPDASKIGSVEVDTPLLEKPLKGAVYVAQQGNAGPAQGSNPFGSLLAIYVAVDDPQTGVVVKLAGKVSADPLTGQLTTSFDEDPQLPFEDFKLDFFGGPRASLVTPSACGTYTTTTSLTPWSAPESGSPANPSYPFQISSGADGAACAPQGFAPSFTAGMTSSQAGGFSPFTLVLARNDGEQALSAIATRMPPGLTGLLARVPLCDEAQANAGTCSPDSQIGHVTVTAGAGPEPIALPQAGMPQDPVFLTGPYHGAPFGLSIVVPAEAGPFNLGTVVVRAKVEVDPHTAQVSVLSDPMPTILQGIPVDVRTVDVTVDREGFLFNPTDCGPLSVDGTITSTQGTSAAVSSRFQAVNCANLPFKPKLTVSTQGKTSKANGASLTVKVSEKPGEANIHKVDLQLPKALPARLTTLQKACTAAQFEANPAGCPAASVIGTGIAHTPLLNVPLTGPAYLVSHGGAAFPDVEFVLQADERGGEVEIVLDGKTDIKKGITSSRFETVPDAPISTFETVLPEGPHSVLSANTNLCAPTQPVTVHRTVSVRRNGHTVHVRRAVKERVIVPLTAPTTIAGQNGAQFTQPSKIAVTGCTRNVKKKVKRTKKVSSHRHARG